VKIVILVEGKTEKCFMPVLRDFLSRRLPGKMPQIQTVPYNGLIPTKDKLRCDVEDWLNPRRGSADAVIALTDIRGTQFADAKDAKAKMTHWVGNEPRFHAHAAQHDFEAWLLPFWSTIQKLAKHNMAAPSGDPEKVNHDRPPAVRIKEIFERGGCRDSYSKPRDAPRILKGNDLTVAANACGELKAFLNTLLLLTGGEPLP